MDRQTCAYCWAVHAELRGTPARAQQVRELEVEIGRARAREQTRAPAATLHRLLGEAAERVDAALGTRTTRP